MRILRSAFLTAALAATLASGVARAQAIPFDIEAGYRFLSVTGNEEMYRSQINDREGFLIRSLHIGTDEKYAGFPLTDKFRIDAADLGAGGAGFLRLDAGLTRRLPAPVLVPQHAVLQRPPGLREPARRRRSASRPGTGRASSSTSTSRSFRAR